MNSSSILRPSRCYPLHNFMHFSHSSSSSSFFSSQPSPAVHYPSTCALLTACHVPRGTTACRRQCNSSYREGNYLGLLVNDLFHLLIIWGVDLLSLQSGLSSVAHSLLPGVIMPQPRATILWQESMHSLANSCYKFSLSFSCATALVSNKSSPQHRREGDNHSESTWVAPRQWRIMICMKQTLACHFSHSLVRQRQAGR